MRAPVDRERIEKLLDRLGRAASVPVRVYLVGGSSRCPLDGKTVAHSSHGEMLDRSLIERARVQHDFDDFEPEQFRFPAIDPGSFRRAVATALLVV